MTQPQGGEVHTGGHMWGQWQPADDLSERRCIRSGCRASQLVAWSASPRVRQVGQQQ